jgi:RNA polymerase sigma-54 factor
MNRRPFLRQSLDLRLTQKLALTPSLLQKIELLQLNKLELQEMLNQELVENPLLEEVFELETPSEMTAEDQMVEGTTARDNAAEQGEKDSFDEIDFRYFFDEYLDTGYKNREVEDFERPSFETFLSQAPSL